jgi:hypothetical protein
MNVEGKYTRSVGENFSKEIKAKLKSRNKKKRKKVKREDRERK